MTRSFQDLRNKMSPERRAANDAAAAEMIEAAKSDHLIMERIRTIRGVPVMLDRDIAELYGVETRVLNQAVKRNIERFPEDFMFQLDKEECLRSQIVILKEKQGHHLKYMPYAFTENGVAMLSGVLRSEKAIETNIRIIRAFVAMRSFLLTSAGVLQRLGAIEIRQIKTDERLDTVFDALGRGNLLPNGILPAESEFDALRYVSRQIESAKTSIVLIDPYSDAVTLEVLAKKHPGVSVRLICKDRGQPTSTEIAKFNRQYKDLAVEYSDKFHDRFLIIDNTELHNLGSSINSLGRRVTTYTTRDAKEISKVMELVKG